jgi:molybdopterin synthase sulfur carrier subunit
MAMVSVLYFASLRDAAGVADERVDHDGDLAALYVRLRAKHGFAWTQDKLRVALDGVFAQWTDVPSDGAEVAFIPPVSGG